MSTTATPPVRSHPTRRAVTAAWLIVSGVTLTVWLVVSIVRGEVETPWFLYSVVGGGVVAAAITATMRRTGR